MRQCVVTIVNYMCTETSNDGLPSQGAPFNYEVQELEWVGLNQVEFLSAAGLDV